ncbi:HAD-IIIC family phosphatase [Leptolyngbya sp. CCY15150]|uniref:HAD-IIIC family phosphatase n=1 Tax=Leptolyngbya sp. CCY15150 TaxID=2767772 RepID=UPI0019507E38|nr:HAD-IIIC family phosphatase [Leptolyngbya sp. CCY15150]
MQSTQTPVSTTTRLQYTVAVAATFTAEPLEESLAFWIDKLALPASVEFTPYNQVFQQLLNPTSLMADNQTGVNVVLLRFEDWWRFNQSSDEMSDADRLADVQRNAQDLIQAFQTALGQSSSAYILGICPSSPAIQEHPDWAIAFQAIEDQIEAELGSASNFHLLRSPDFERYGSTSVYDPERDRLGHIPFTPDFFATLGTTLARRIYAIKRSPYKVIVLDCDNTIWKGIVGEDGVDGIQVTDAFQTLQRFMIEQQEAGMVLCLCSKNNEADVMEVFEQRTDMPLKLDHLVSWRVNWLPKSGNIQSLAEDLNLGLDSFIFIDDNPVECAEVRLNCPEVLSLQLPKNETDIPAFLEHVWAFDHLRVTEEDRKRTALYQQNVARSRLEKEAPSLEVFLASLDLSTTMTAPTAEQQSRVAQLTQRTNQFNCTTRRRSEADVQQLAAQGLNCRAVEVSDRFGDYGLVGVMIFGPRSGALEVDTFLLSCRVLGRGVEYQMLSELGKIAQRQGLSTVRLLFIPSKKNQPALSFLERCGAEFQQTTDEGFCFEFPTDYAANLTYNPTNDRSDTASSKPKSPSSQSQGSPSERLQMIATELRSPTQVLQHIRRQGKGDRPDLGYTAVAPNTETETILVDLWSDLLNLKTVGITDDYFDLGGTSLLAVEVVVQIEQRFGERLPLTTLLERPTIQKLAQRLDHREAQTGEPTSLILLQSGDASPPLFLIHDGDGETLLYRNLAKRLAPRPVYGIQPLSRPGFPILHTRIQDMAAYYIQQIRQVQPEGPYLLGGMCAGGVLSFEIACQLEAQGQTVALVALMDAAYIHAQEKVGRIASQRLNRFTQALEEESRRPLHERLLGIAVKVVTKASNLVRYETQSRIQKASDRLQFKLMRFYLDRQAPLPKFLKGLPVRTVYLLSAEEYKPKKLYQGELLLLRATTGEGDNEPHICRFVDNLLGWGDLTAQDVKVYDVAGGHASMLQEPAVEDMTQRIHSYIEQTLQQT